jgi:hypothetical protein
VRGLVVVLLLTGCKGVDPAVASGEVIHTVTREVIETGFAVYDACKSGRLTDAQCDAWATFVAKFKTSRAIALKAWNYGVDNEDAIQKGKATDIILSLSAELGEFTRLVLDLAGTRAHAATDGGTP